MAYQPYTIGKPGVDDGRTWAGLRKDLKRSDVEKIEVAAGAAIPAERRDEARSNTLAHATLPRESER